MQSGRFRFRVIATLLLVSFSCYAQSAKPSRDSTISVQQLSMSAKAQREYERGTRLLQEGKLDGSIDHLLRVIAEKPRYYGPYHNLAMAYLRLGQYDAAAQNFQKSIDLAGAGYAPSFYGLAMVFFGKEEFEQAEILAKRAFALEPSSGGDICLGTVQLAVGHLADAEHSAREAIRLDPRAAEAYFLLASIHDRQHNPSAVISDLQAYLKLVPRGGSEPDVRELLTRAQRTLSSESAALH